MVAENLEKLPTDRDKWKSEYKDYAEAQAADLIEFLEGIPAPPEEITNDMSPTDKRDIKTATEYYTRRRNMAWKFIHTILKDSNLKS